MRTLETKRLILRDWQPKDLSDLFICLSNPHVVIPTGASPCKSLDECKRILDYLIKMKNNYAIELKSKGIVIGSIGLNEDAKRNENVRNLGYYLAEEYWNQGLMTEALTVAIAGAKDVTNMLSATHGENAKSEHLLKKFGFRQVDIIKNVKRKIDMESHDEPYYILELK